MPLVARQGCKCADCCAELAGKTVAGALHLCFELAHHGESTVSILPGLVAALREDGALLQACLPSLALLAQLCPQSTANTLMVDMLSLCSCSGTVPYSLRGARP